MKLNIGCGPHYAAGWTNVDVVRVEAANIAPDIIASIDDLPFEDGTIGYLYAGHLLEHVPLARFDDSMAEVARVLGSTGRACFVCPDVYRAIQGYADGWVDHATMLGCLEGPDSGVTADGSWAGHYHEWNCTERRLLDLVRRTFPDAVAVPMDSPELDGFPLVSRIGWQCAVITRVTA